MSLLKNTKNVSQPIFRQNQYITFTAKKECPRIWATSVFKKLTKENNHPLGEKIAQSGHPAGERTRDLLVFVYFPLSRPLNEVHVEENSFRDFSCVKWKLINASVACLPWIIVRRGMLRKEEPFLCRSIVSLKLFYCEKTWLGGTVTG
jgi:hypothetical protein